MGSRLLLFVLFFGFHSSSAQLDTVPLVNPSFEDAPRRGTLEWGYYSSPPEGWYDCGRIEFPRETPPDIHPVDYWEVERPAYDGDTYLGMVVRDVDTWESLSQRLKKPVEGGKCYKFSIYMSKSNRYVSISQEFNRPDNYTTPAVLRIWGGDGHCARKELLVESDPIDNFDWERYEFSLKPANSHRYIMLEAFYKTPTLFAYNGHILMDNASYLIQTYCPGEEPLAEENISKPVEQETRPGTPRKQITNRNTEVPESTREEIVESLPPTPNASLFGQLNRNTLKKGQTIRIEKLYFQADSAIITRGSYPVLDQIFLFLKENKDIVVEIGGHTNGNFGITHAYCDQLSNERAKAVAEYIMRKGISPKRLQYKGYGKRFPIGSNTTVTGRQKNQRVEIKILSIES